MAGYAYSFPFLTQGIRKFYSSSSAGDNFYKNPGLQDLNSAQLALAKAILEYQPVTSYSESFRKLANGVFQAEGCVSAWFNGGSLTVSPVSPPPFTGGIGGLSGYLSYTFSYT